MKTALRNFMLLSALICAIFNGALSVAEMVDKVIVIVNDEVITQREFDRAFLPVQQSFQARFKGEELKSRLEEVKGQLLEQLINSKLIVSLAKKQDIKIDEKELNEKIESVKSYYGTEDDFLLALSSKGTNLTEFEREIREQMLGQKLVEKEVSSKIVVTPAEIKDLYNKNKDRLVIPKRIKARSIMIRKGSGAEERAARDKINRVVRDLKKGRKFEKLASEESEGPYADNGGDMGYVSPGQMLPEIDEVLFSLDKGQVSDVVETSIGYHVFLVEEIEDSRVAELAEVSDYLREQLFRKKFEENLVKWIEEKRKNAYISYK
ncbi:MAG: peptidylprolyl isomerase [Candidatus Omnitrophota bacterium]|jgi:parvulin-like peptidyl-prolyl isomerase